MIGIWEDVHKVDCVAMCSLSQISGLQLGAQDLASGDVSANSYRLRSSELDRLPFDCALYS